MRWSGVGSEDGEEWRGRAEREGLAGLPKVLRFWIVDINSSF